MRVRSASGRTFAALAVFVAIDVAALAMPAAASMPPQTATRPQTSTSTDQTGAFRFNDVAPGSHTITLITGDRLRLTGSGGKFTVSVDRIAPRSAGEAEPLIRVTSDGDAVYAIPDDAEPAVASGRLDRELFDVKYLAENGYADDKAKQLPVIVQYAASRSASSVKTAAEALPASTPTHQLTSIHGASLTVPKADVKAFWSTVRGAAPAPGKAAATTLGAGIAKVWLDGKAKASLDVSVPLIGAPQAWANGHDGSGVNVAVLDTGVDATHPDLADKIVTSQSFVPGEDVTDHHGHGTHVASTIAGTGAAEGGKYTGVAKGAKLLVGKVLNNSGSGQDSWIIDGMEWATANGAKVVSMSLGGDPTDGTDPLSQAVDDLTASTGTLFVIAAGNSGPAAETVSSPGTADAALTVAATDKVDRLAGFSSRGPRFGDKAFKPDIAGPGVDITAARAAGTSLGTPVDEHYTTLSGTSMATPHVAGAAAILAQEHPDWKAGQLKAALMSTAKDDGFTVYEQGAGRVDVARADRQQVFAATSNVDFGNLDPGQHPDPVSRQITYTNLGNAPVTLTLTRSLRQVGANPVPDGTFTGEDTVTVPANGTATTTVTLDVNPLTVGRYTGAVVAKDPTGQTALTTPVGLDREPPRINLTIRVLDRDGEQANSSSVNLTAVDVPDTDVVRMTQVAPGVFRAAVQAGTYSAEADMAWVDPATSVLDRAVLTDPQIEVTGDTDVTLDARKAKEVTMRTPRPTASYGQVITKIRSRWDGRLLVSLIEGGFSFAQGPIYVTPTERVTKGVFGFNVSRMLANPQITMRVTGNEAFDLQLFHRGYSDRGQRTGGTEIGGPAWVPWPTTHRRVGLVDVGYARPEDLAGKNLKGKLAVMQWGDDRFGADFGDPPDGIPDSEIWTDRVHALAEAGAIGYVAVSNPPAGQEKNASFSIPTTFVAPGPAGSPQDVDLPEVQVSRDQGMELIRRLRQGPVSVDLNVDPNIHRIEQIYPVYDQQVPESLDTVLNDDQMVAVDANYYSAQPITLATGAGVFMTGSQGFGGSVDVFSAGPSQRTEYFGPLNARTTLLKDRSTISGPAESGVSITAYPKAGKSTERWFAAGSAPGTFNLGAAFDAQDAKSPVAWYPCMMCREGDLFWPFLVPAALGDGTTGSGGFGVGDVRLFRQDGQEIPATPVNDALDLPAFQLPPEPATYRMTDEKPGKHTSWTFRSASATKDDWMPGAPCPRHLAGVTTDKCEQQPVIFLGYDLGNALRPDNTVLAGGSHQFTVYAYHPRSRGDLPDIAGLRLWTSTDDGVTWKQASVKRDAAGTFTVKANYPKLSATTGAVSIKAEAWDADGNQVHQELDRAFNLSDNTTNHVTGGRH